MRKKKLLVVLMAITLAGGMVSACGNETSDNAKEEKQQETEKTEKSEKSKIQMPEGDELDEELMAEFVEANSVSALCEKYGSIQIDSKYVYMDENGKKSSGGADSMVYIQGENGLISGTVGDGYSSYSEGEQITYSVYSDEEATSYSVNYFSDSFCELMDADSYYGLYSGSEYADSYCYKETSDGYEIYEFWDMGDGLGNVMTYYANKDKLVTRMESMCYPENAARYVDTESELKTETDIVLAKPEVFETGELTVTVIEKTSGKQTDIKVPAGTEVYFGVNAEEAATYDEEGTQFVGGERYSSFLTVNENTTVYIVEIGADMDFEEEGIMEEPVG